MAWPTTDEQGMGMVGTSVQFTSERAPCGHLVGGQRHRDSDDEGLVIDDTTYACGCRTIHHEFHDGSVRNSVTRHDGKLLIDEHSPNHGD
jgi:hypothetical protein